MANLILETRLHNLMPVHDIRSAPSYRQTVLIIDDQPMMLTIHAAVLKSVDPDLRIISMTDPRAALEWMRQKQVDLIITDYRMHNMDGIHFVNTVRRSSFCPLLPIIVVTALKDEKIHQQLLAAGVSACLIKPAQAVQLSQLSRTLLEKSRERYSVQLNG
ncbi:response regulator [Ferrovum myxofaciens]|uniref:response regulator n=1 Tax=Ferrovum myxofaciens TaxID=416213 RepID=UPI003EBBCB19